MEKDDSQKKYGSLKIAWHPDKLEALLKGKVTAPISVRVKPTNKCDHRCFYCSYDPEAKNILSQTINRTDEIPFEKMMEILSDFNEIGVKGVTYSGGGEPLVYPYIEKTFAKTLDNNIDLSIITNGQRLYGERAELLTQAKWVRISLDSCNPETFVKSRRVKKELFYQLKENIKNFAETKNPDCELGINFVIHHLNSEDVYNAAVFFRELGVNHIRFTPRWMEEKWSEYHAPFKESVINQISKARKELPDDNFKVYDTYENDFKLTGVPRREYSKCYIMQTVPVIGADCAVYFCHDKTYTKGGLLGSIKDKSFKEIWFSKETKEKFENFNPEEECRQHCVYDARNILIRDILDSYGKHINFI